MSATWQQIARAAFVVSVLLDAAAFVVVLGNSGDTS